MIDVILAVPDLPGEADLVAQAPALGIRIVRRCVDAVDLLAATAADPRVPLIVSAGLPRLPADLADRVGEARILLGLAATDEQAADLARIGLRVQRASPSAADTWGAVRTLLDEAAGTGVWRTGVWEAPDREDGPAEATVDPGTSSRRPGSVIVVWGPQGAPGRTTVAVGLAEAIADAGATCLLIDADTYGPSVTLALGIVEDASGLVVACRHADNGTLTSATLTGLAHRLSQRWWVLGGVGSTERWPEARSAGLERVWAAAREACDVTVVDVGFCLEAEAGPWSSRRNGATISALAAADRVIAVGDASALGAARLAAAWPALVACTPLADRLVVRNRAGRRDHGWTQAVADLGVGDPVMAVPRDDRAASACWASGRSPREAARRSGLRRALGAVAARAVTP